MSHEITRANGVAEAAYATTPAWHGLGWVNAAGAMTAADAMAKSHTDWKVKKVAAFAVDLENSNSYPATDFNGIVRVDTGTVLGMVSADYGVVQNVECFDMIDSIIGRGEMHIEACGSLRGGKRIWILARMPEPWFVSGDQHNTFVLLTSSHDGSMALEIRPTSVRVVCNNTLQMAIRNNPAVIRFAHTSNISTKIGNVERMMGFVKRTQLDFSFVMQALANVKANRLTLQNLLDVVMPVPDPVYSTKGVPEGSPLRLSNEKLIARVEADRNIIFNNFAAPSCPSAEGTMFGALQAVTDWTDNQWKPRVGDEKLAESRFSSLFYGEKSQLKRDTLAAACALAGVK